MRITTTLIASALLACGVAFAQDDAAATSTASAETLAVQPQANQGSDTSAQQADTPAKTKPKKATKKHVKKCSKKSGKKCVPVKSKKTATPAENTAQNNS